MVERRCATTTVVRPALALSSASCTMLSDCASRALAASSRKRILGLPTRALAMAIRCFCPPLSIAPRSPIMVSYPCGRRSMNLCALAAFAASMICSRETLRKMVSRSFPSPVTSSPAPNAMFSAMVILKRMGICPTTPTCARSQRTLRSRTLVPSSATTESGVGS
mmetsp:Transcript_11552/g.29208  ORF Transcript_11552/g.29208 Transcript_11552/m.29208 type:complete len:165 (+) Transcript_11552:2093-2587(+)